MAASLRLAEAQNLNDSLQVWLAAVLSVFFDEERQTNLEMLHRAVRQHQRDTLKESLLAGKVEAYEEASERLHGFAQRQLKEAIS